MTQPFLILTGPTAVGKTDLSLQLARTLSAEIVSADSRQVYRQMRIGTAKPPPDVLAAVPHHFVDELDLDTPFSAGAFAEQAFQRIREIVARGRVPLVVGGSTLYLHALRHGLADIPPVPSSVRRDVEARLSREGAEALYAELRSVDPASAATMDATKTQRLVRALEVYHGTGEPLSSFHAAQAPPPFRFRTIVLYRERAELYARIEHRVDQMLAEGLVDEVQGILADGYSPDLNPLRTIGYQEVIAVGHLMAGVLWTERVISIAGPAVIAPRLVCRRWDKSQAADRLQKARQRLFTTIHERPQNTG